MLLGLFLIFVSMLASEPWMVVHVTTCAIQSRILGGSSINVKNLLDPLHVELLVLFAQVVILWNWALWICWLAWIEVAWIRIERTDVPPWHRLFLRIGAINRIGWD